MRVLRQAVLAFALSVAATSAFAAGFEEIVVSATEDADVSDESFATDTADIHLSADITDEIAAGSKITVSWIAVNTGGRAPDNYRINETTHEVGTFGNHLNASLSKPDAGFPAGTYQIELSVDGKVEETVPFVVK